MKKSVMNKSIYSIYNAVTALGLTLVNGLLGDLTEMKSGRE